MRNDQIVTLKNGMDHTWIAVPDRTSGKRARYTVYRIAVLGDKRADIVGRELLLAEARKLAAKPLAVKDGPAFDHHCGWREASVKLAKCVVTTIQSGGKIGMGSGMVMSKVDGKTVIERWDKDFIEALNFIGLEVSDAKPSARKRRAA